MEHREESVAITSFSLPDAFADNRGERWGEKKSCLISLLLRISNRNMLNVIPA